MSEREAILACDDRAKTAVHCAEWGCDLYARSMSIGERSDFEEAIRGKSGLEQVLGWVVFGVVDESGERVFQLGDEEALKGKNAAVVLRLYEAVASVNGIEERDADDIAKN